MHLKEVDLLIHNFRVQERPHLPLGEDRFLEGGVERHGPCETVLHDLDALQETKRRDYNEGKITGDMTSISCNRNEGETVTQDARGLISTPCNREGTRHGENTHVGYRKSNHLCY